MRIVIDVRNLLDKQYSGVSEYTFQLLVSLFKIDKENEYILFYNSFKNQDQRLPFFDYPNVTYKKLSWPNKLFNLTTAIFNYPKIDKLIPNIDLLFLPNINFIAKSKNIKSILTLHDLSFLKYKKFFNLKTRIWHFLINPKKLISQQTKIITVSKHIGIELMKFYNVPADKIETIHEGIDKTILNFKPTALKLDEIKKKYNLPEKFLLYIGTIEPRKNLESIFDALKNLDNNIPLVIAGKNGWKHKKILKNTQTNHEIKYIKYIPRKDKLYLYTLATIFIWPSFYEGFGLPPLEAQSCKTPVIVGAHSSLSEVIGNSGMLVNTDNINEINFAIKTLWTDENLREYFIELGKKNIKKYSWDKTAEQTLSLFRMTIS